MSDINFKLIADVALGRSESLCAQWLPDGKKVGHEWKARNPMRADRSEGSFSINLNTGAWGDFATDDKGGDLVSLYAYLFHNNSMGHAAKELAVELGVPEAIPAKGRGQSGAKRQARSNPVDPDSKPKPEKRSPWIPVLPVPDDAPSPPTAHEFRGIPERIWTYRDADGRTLGFICRFSNSKGGKEIIPLVFVRHEETGLGKWAWQQWEEPRPLYGLDRLAARPDDTVMLVEGEKCTDAGQDELPDLVVVTWPGGSKAIDKVDWSPLAGRKVIDWADCDAQRKKLTKDEQASGFDPMEMPLLEEKDQPGVKAMSKIRSKLHELGCKLWSMQIPKPGEKPSGWDIADAIAEGLKGDELADYIRQHAQLVPHPSESIPTPLEAGAGGEMCPPDIDGPNDWYRRMLFGQKGDLERCVANVYDVLTNDPLWDGVLGFDEFAQRVVKRRDPPYVTGVEGEWTDQDTIHSAIWMTRRYRFAPGREIVAQAVDAAARNATFNPVVDWLRGLNKWDGTKRIGTWLERYVGAVPTSDDQREYLRLAGGWFLMGIVARALVPGCKFDYSLILEGEQGKRKSTILSALVGDNWFSDVELDLHNKDSMMAIQGKLLVEIAEMGAMARSDEKRQKAFLSRRFDEFRIPFATSFVKLPRRMVFAGTTNEWEWNKDPTGGRRFWPVEVGTLDVEGLIADREQLFAEALEYYEAGKRYWPTHDEQKRLFDPEQLKREQQESLVDALHDWVWQQIAPFSISSAAIDGLNMDASKLTRDFQTRCGTALRKLGCRKIEKRNGMVRYWYEPPKKAVESDPNQSVQHRPAQHKSDQQGGRHADF